jgi:hypothetical protein
MQALHVPCAAYRDRMSAPLRAGTTSSIARRRSARGRARNGCAVVLETIEYRKDRLDVFVQSAPLKELESRQVVGIVDE